uniref:Uncharacterized protein n=1 Tax=Mesocestoides corti TaxID=53468 RepID=A0A5K3FWV8_MESCO
MLDHLGAANPLSLCFPMACRKIGNQPENDIFDKLNVISGVSSLVESDRRRLTCGSGLCLVSNALLVVPVFFTLCLGYSTWLSGAVTKRGAEILNQAELS